MQPSLGLEREKASVTKNLIDLRKLPPNLSYNESVYVQ